MCTNLFERLCSACFGAVWVSGVIEYCLSIAGAYSFISNDHQSSRTITQASGAATRENPVFDDAHSESESTDTWPFDNMSCYTPTALQHTYRQEQSVHLASVAGDNADQKLNMMEIADSAWETLHQEQYLRRCSDTSGSTVTCNTSFIQHVGDKLFDRIAK